MMSSSTFDFGKWLADQEYRYDALGEDAWLLDAAGNYLAEGVSEDSEDKCLGSDEMKQALQLMQHAPPLLRVVLRALKVLDNATLNDTRKLDSLKLMLEGVASNCLGPHNWLEVARTVSRQQAQAGG